MYHSRGKRGRGGREEKMRIQITVLLWEDQEEEGGIWNSETFTFISLRQLNGNDGVQLEVPPQCS